MKRIRFPYEGKRANKYVAYIDNVLGSCIIVCFVFQGVLGIPDMLQLKLGVSEFCSKLLVLIIVLALGAIEQFITYHIDKWIQRKQQGGSIKNRGLSPAAHQRRL